MMDHFMNFILIPTAVLFVIIFWVMLVFTAINPKKACQFGSSTIEEYNFCEFKHSKKKEEE